MEHLRIDRKARECAFAHARHRARTRIMGKQTHEAIAARLEAMEPTPGAVLDIRATLATIPELRALICAALIRGLAATKYYWDKEKEKWVHVPDYLAQNKAAALLVAYSDGLPVQTAVNVNLDPGKGQGFSLGDALSNSPALREHLAKELAQAERKTLAA